MASDDLERARLERLIASTQAMNDQVARLIAELEAEHGPPPPPAELTLVKGGEVDA